MFARQAAKAKAAAEPFKGFSGSAERIALLGLMIPQVSWRVRRKMNEEHALRDLIERNDAEMQALGVPPLSAPAAVEGLAPLPQIAVVKEHRQWRERNRRIKQRARFIHKALITAINSEQNIFDM
jgi:hypothetical protein